MQILVLYFSKSGRTKLLAHEAAKGVETAGATALLKSTEDVVKSDFLNSAGVIAGSPVYFGLMASELKQVFDNFVSIRRKMENKIGAAFATGGNPSGGKETTLISIIQCMLIYGMIVVGDPMDASGHYGVAGVDPTEVDIAKNAFLLGERVARLCKQLHS